MERISFQGRNLATAHRIWQRMLAGDVVIFLGVAGALTAGGLRLAIARLIRDRAVDCVVSTGANLYHDLHETRGRRHFVGSPRADDRALQAARIDRVYDTYVDEDEFVDNDHWIADFTSRARGAAVHHARVPPPARTAPLERDRRRRHPHGGLPRQGAAVLPGDRGFVDRGWGWRRPGTHDPESGRIDVIGDIIESTNLVIRRPRTASIVLGGGTPKNFINQASVQADFCRPGAGGHRYALQIITDAPHFGGASGSSLDEARSWGKLAADADQVTVHADATLAFPLLTSALTASARELLAARCPPVFELGGRALSVDGTTAPVDRFHGGESRRRTAAIATATLRPDSRRAREVAVG